MRMNSRALGLYVPGLRAVDPLQSSDPAVFEKQCEAVGAVASYANGTPNCVLAAYAQNDNSRFNPNVPAVPGAVPVAAYRANPSTGGCPIIDPDTMLCAYGADGTIGCKALLECDWFTGMVHKEAPMPGAPTANATLYANAGPRTSTTTSPAPSNNPVVPPITQDVMKAVTQPAGSSGNPAPSGSSSSSSSSNMSSFDVGGFLQQQSVGSIPNWVLIGGAAAVIIFFAVKK